jgi:hypothetical protein
MLRNKLSIIDYVFWIASSFRSYQWQDLVSRDTVVLVILHYLISIIGSTNDKIWLGTQVRRS